MLAIPCLYGTELTYYSQIEQDKYLNENVFKNKQNGIFVDIGAYDGITGSNSCFFEKHLNWKGLCIEPIPERFEDLKRNRPQSKNLNCCVGEKGQKEFLRISGPDEMLSGLISKYDPRHLQLVKTIGPQVGDKHDILLIECIPLMEILEKNKIDHIDYLSLDTEGGELDILKSIDFDKITIEIIDVENNYSNEEFEKFLTSKGYKFLVRLVVDDIYQKIR